VTYFTNPDRIKRDADNLLFHESKSDGDTGLPRTPKSCLRDAASDLYHLASLKRIDIRLDPAYPHFGLVGEPVAHRQHQNQQNGLDLYVNVINLDTGEVCFKKLYKNARGLHFKHTGYSSMYLVDFSEDAVVYPFQFVRPLQP
jgi:hypothetical protein